VHPENYSETDPQSTPNKIRLVGFKEFASFARRRSWTAQSLTESFRGRIEGAGEFFNRVLGGKFPDNLIPFRSVIEFYQTESARDRAVEPELINWCCCACGCKRPVFVRQRWATPGCQKRVARKRHGLAKVAQNRA